MKKLKVLFNNNEAWVEKNTRHDQDYYLRMTKGQKPLYMWIGCSDSRIPANEVVGLEPGELFVHRNVANLFVPTDLNCLSVLKYAIDFLEIEHVIVCGHYGCGGVNAAMEDRSLGIMDSWLNNIRDVHAQSHQELSQIEDREARHNRLVELNVLQQIRNLSQNSIVQNAWMRKQPLCLHGWVYELATGKLRDLDCCISGMDM